MTSLNRRLSLVLALALASFMLPNAVAMLPNGVAAGTIHISGSSSPRVERAASALWGIGDLR